MRPAMITRAESKPRGLLSYPLGLHGRYCVQTDDGCRVRAPAAMMGLQYLRKAWSDYWYIWIAETEDGPTRTSKGIVITTSARFWKVVVTEIETDFGKRIIVIDFEVQNELRTHKIP